MPWPRLISTGADVLNARLLLLGVPIRTFSVTNFFNLTIVSGIIPSIWKAAHALPLQKGVDSSDPNNYRPIKKLIYYQLRQFLSQHCILNPHQSGFRPGQCTLTAACHGKVVNDVISALDKKECCIALFIILSKTFDTVDHTLLLDKLRAIGFNTEACNWFHDFKLENKFNIKNTISTMEAFCNTF